MRKVILMMLLAVMSSSAMAEWVKADISEAYTTYTDPTTIRKANNKVKMWVMFDYKTARSVKGKQFKSVQVQSEFSCKEEQMRNLFTSAYSENAGRGTMVYNDPEPSQWEPITPASIGVTTLRIACGQQDEKRSSITKNDARTLLLEKMNSDANFRDNPAKIEMFLCMVDEALDEVFSGVTAIDSATLESRFFPAMDHILASKDPAVDFRVRKCVFNSNALAQAMKEKGEQDRQVPLIDMDDLRTDMVSLNGRKVRVQGVGHYMINMFMLKKNSSDMSPMIVDITKLQRDQRRKILQQCADIMTGCRVTVYGTVGKVMYQNGIFAENIEW